MRTLVASIWALLVLGPTQQAQFRARAEMVSVDVGVFSGSRPVAGLGATDFGLTDNGVAQKLESFSLETVPIDVTLVLDETGTMRHHFLEELRESVRRLSPVLAAETRVRLLTFSRTLREIPDWRNPNGLIDTERLEATGMMSPQDALALVLIRGGSSDRRHVVVLLTDGVSEFGGPVIRTGKLLEAAKRFDGVLHVVLFQRRFNLDEFRDVAEATGGQLHRPASRIGETFEGIFESFRRSYVLRYVPTGVVREGWHEIDVKVTRPGGNKYTVRARKGYFVD